MYNILLQIQAYAAANNVNMPPRRVLRSVLYNDIGGSTLPTDEIKRIYFSYGNNPPDEIQNVAVDAEDPFAS
jgi:hypothetical protein